MEALASFQPKLTYLEPELFVNNTNEELDSHFICVICTGVVLEPVECVSC